MKPISSVITILFLTFLSSNVFADDTKKVNIAIPEFVLEKNYEDPLELGKESRKILENDLKFSEQFDLIDPSLYNEIAILEQTRITVDYNSWGQMGAQWLVKTNYKINPRDNSFIVTFKLYDIATKRFLLGKRYTATKKFLPKIMHRFAYEIILQLKEKRGLAEMVYSKNPFSEEQKIKSLLKSVENRTPASKGFGYIDFYFGDPLEVVEDLIKKRCSPTKRPFMKGDFEGKFVPSIYTDESKALNGWCYDKFMHFLFNNNETLTRIIWEVSAKNVNESVIQKYQRLRKQLAGGNEHKLTKARSTNNLERAKGQDRTIIFDEFDNGALLLVLEIERIQTQIYAIYQDKSAAKNYTKIKDGEDF